MKKLIVSTAMMFVLSLTVGVMAQDAKTTKKADKEKTECCSEKKDKKADKKAGCCADKKADKADKKEGCCSDKKAADKKTADKK